jgi:hypothetical protein
MQTEEERIADVRANVTRRVKSLGASGRAKDAIRELASMAQLGVQPDAQAATTLVAACVQSRQMDLANNVFHELFGEFCSSNKPATHEQLRPYAA